MTAFSEINAGGRTGLTAVFCGDIKKIKRSAWVIAALFVAMRLLTR